MTNWPATLRHLLRRPSFSVTALILLALGIGATTALFSIADTVLLKPLPYPDAQELVSVFEASPAKNQKESLIAPARLEDWTRLNRTFIALAGYQTENVTDTSISQPERLAARRVTPATSPFTEQSPCWAARSIRKSKLLAVHKPPCSVIASGPIALTTVRKSSENG